MLARVQGTNQVIDVLQVDEPVVGTYKVTKHVRSKSSRLTGKLIFMTITLTNGESYPAYCIGKDYAICRLHSDTKTLALTPA
jgi:hypothetical protein